MAKKDNDAEELDDADEASGKTGGKKKLIIILAAVLLLAIGGGGAAFFLMSGKDDKKKDAATEESAEGTEGEAAAEGDGKATAEKDAGPVYYELPEFLVNLSTANKSTSFLKMRVTLELASKKDIKTVEKFMPRITDSFNTYLRELRPTDLAGSAGMQRLREELILRINQAIAPTKVGNILFKDVLVQ
jgi:flagellar FliL protein